MKTDCTAAEIDAEIRRRRHETWAGGALGPLLSEFGAEAVVRALGTRHIAASLGLTDASQDAARARRERLDAAFDRPFTHAAAEEIE